VVELKSGSARRIRLSCVVTSSNPGDWHAAVLLSSAFFASSLKVRLGLEPLTGWSSNTWICVQELPRRWFRFLSFAPLAMLVRLVQPTIPLRCLKVRALLRRIGDPVEPQSNHLLSDDSVASGPVPIRGRKMASVDGKLLPL
jgi:hypothetical protein